MLFPDDGITKATLARYYLDIARCMLPHVRDRPATLERYPDGIAEPGFLQKDASKYFPDWIATATMPKKGGTVRYVLCNDAATLVYIAGQASVTPHVWTSRADRPMHPDQLVFDLDPPSEDFELVRRTALDLRALLDEELGLPVYVKTSGSRGLHVVVPLNGSQTSEDVMAFAHGVAQVLIVRSPETLTLEVSKAARGDRLLLDIGRNAYGQTAAAAYAVRARPGAPVSTPLEWDEVTDPALGARTHTIFTVTGRETDPWKAMRRHGRSLAGPARKLAKLR